MPLFLTLLLAAGVAFAESKTLTVFKTADFDLNGQGTQAAWERASWEPLTAAGRRPELSRFKILYSTTGIYVLFQGADKKVTASKTEDFSELWLEDVFEAFFWPDEKTPIYLEYAISPLGRELPMLVPNLDGKFQGWLPWGYKEGRKARKATTVQGGQKKTGSPAGGWTAEFYLPFDLFRPLQNVPPAAGSEWRANFYRIDYDEGTSNWTWSPIVTKFHDPKRFGTLKFQ